MGLNMFVDRGCVLLCIKRKDFLQSAQEEGPVVRACFVIRGCVQLPTAHAVSPCFIRPICDFQWWFIINLFVIRSNPMCSSSSGQSHSLRWPPRREVILSPSKQNETDAGYLTRCVMSFPRSGYDANFWTLWIVVTWYMWLNGLHCIVRKPNKVRLGPKINVRLKISSYTWNFLKIASILGKYYLTERWMNYLLMTISVSYNTLQVLWGKKTFPHGSISFSYVNGTNLLHFYSSKVIVNHILTNVKI